MWGAMQTCRMFKNTRTIYITVRTTSFNTPKQSVLNTQPSVCFGIGKSIRLLYPEDEGARMLRNIGNCVPVDTA